MHIEGPLKIGIVDKPDTLERELHLDFTEAFKRLKLEEQGPAFDAYLAGLRQQIGLTDGDSTDRQGMLLVLQVAEQLAPYIRTGELPLHETIIVEITPDTPLHRFMAGQPLN